MSRVILSWQKHDLGKMAQHPVWLNRKNVQHREIHNFLEEIIPMTDFIVKYFPLVSIWNLLRINIVPIVLYLFHGFPL